MADGSSTVESNLLILLLRLRVLEKFISSMLPDGTTELPCFRLLVAKRALSWSKSSSDSDSAGENNERPKLLSTSSSSFAARGGKSNWDILAEDAIRSSRPASPAFLSVVDDCEDEETDLDDAGERIGRFGTFFAPAAEETEVRPALALDNEEVE